MVDTRLKTHAPANIFSEELSQTRTSRLHGLQVLIFRERAISRAKLTIQCFTQRGYRIDQLPLNMLDSFGKMVITEKPFKPWREPYPPMKLTILNPK